MRMNSLTGQTFYRDPFQAFAQWRPRGPLIPVKIPIIGKVWLTTTHSAATKILKDNGNFTQRSASGGLAGLKWWMPRSLKVLAGNMLTSDGGEHKRLRSLVDAAFARRNVATMENGIETAAHELAGWMQATMHRAGRADLVGDFARLLPLMVISDLLGLPRKDRDFFLKTAGTFSEVSNLIGFFRMLPALKRLSAYLDGKIAEARHSGGEGLIAHLVAEAEDGHTSGEELLATAFLLLIAGHETTTHLISGSVKTLFDEPDKRAWLADDWSRLDLAVEEFLRFVSPVQMTKPRHARAGAEIDGVTIARGERVVVSLTGANGDPAMFSEPERLVLDRHPNPHIAFGTGVHFCLGHQLARLEARIAVRTLLERFPDLSLDCDPSALRWRKRVGLRALVSLPVTTGRANGG